jgi:TolB protein
MDFSWSPDGRWIAYVRALSPIAATSEIWLIGVGDRQSSRLTDGAKKEDSPTWSPDSRHLYFVSDRGGTPDLWRFTIGKDGRSEGAPQQVTAGIEMLRASLSTDGQKLAFSKGRTIRNIFKTPLLADRPAAWVDAVQLTYDEAECETLDVSRDGRLLISSDRSGNWDLYLMSASGGDLLQLTTNPGVDAGPRWSPDGREVVFYSTRSGHREVWIMPIDGGPARQLTRGEAESRYPAWSPTGGEIIMAEVGLTVSPVQGGRVRRLTDSSLDTYPDCSPDGRWVAFTSLREGKSRPWLISAAGGTPQQLSDREGYVVRWSVDGKGIHFIGGGDRRSIWSLSTDSREERPVAVLPGRRGVLGAAGLATDGQFIYFTWEEKRGDIWVADIVGTESGR